MSRAVRGGVPISRRAGTCPDSELFEDVAEVGPGGNLLATQAARRAARSGEFIEPSLIGRVPYDAWLHQRRPSMYGRARAKVEAILAAPMADQLSDQTVAELDRILAEADRALAEV